MPQVPRPLFLIHFWNLEISPFLVLDLWANKSLSSSMKVKATENSYNKMSLKWCKWSSLNAPGTQTPLYHLVLKFAKWPFSIIGDWLSGEIRNGPQYESEKFGKFPEQKGLEGM